MEIAIRLANLSDLCRILWALLRETHSKVLKIGEAALGADSDHLSFDGDAQMPTSTPAVRDPRDARAVSRILMLLNHFGQRSSRDPCGAAAFKK